MKLYPNDWKLTETPVLQKPGKPDYTLAAAWRPIMLSNGMPRLLNRCKTEDLVLMCEKMGILPPNHFSGRPGRVTTDSVHLLVKTVKDAWRRGEVASLLCLDVKVAFPSTAVDVLLHEMRLCGVPLGHVEWFKRRLEGRKMMLIFDDYESGTFDIEEGIDQGDTQLLIAWIIYNHQILNIFERRSREIGFLYVDDAAVLVTGEEFSTTHNKLKEVMNQEGGMLEWAASHNCTFGVEKFQLLNLLQKKMVDPERPLHEMMHKFDLKPQLMEKIEAIRQEPKWEPDVAISIAGNKEVAKAEDLADITHIKVYIDRSGLEGKIGGAAVLYCSGVLKSRRRMLLGSAEHHTVYEGKGVGMILGLELIREERQVEGMVSMGTDNTAAITATHAIKPGPSHYLWDIFHKRLAKVRYKHKEMDLLVKWVPGHMDIVGNDRADTEAKKAATNRSSPQRKLPAPLRKPLPKSKSAVQQAYHHRLKLAAGKVWSMSPRFDRMALIDPELSLNKFAKLT